MHIIYIYTHICSVYIYMYIYICIYIYITEMYPQLPKIVRNPARKKKTLPAANMWNDDHQSSPLHQLDGCLSHPGIHVGYGSEKRLKCHPNDPSWAGGLAGSFSRSAYAKSSARCQAANLGTGAECQSFSSNPTWQAGCSGLLWLLQ